MQLCRDCPSRCKSVHRRNVLCAYVLTNAMSYLGAMTALNGVASGLYLGQEAGYFDKGAQPDAGRRVLTADSAPETATRPDARNAINVQWAVLVLGAVILYASTSKCKKR